MQSSSVEIRHAGGAVGAEITGVDLSEPLAPSARDTIRETLADRGVVFFRDQSLTPEQHIGLARQFGVRGRAPLGTESRISGCRREGDLVAEGL